MMAAGISRRYDNKTPVSESFSVPLSADIFRGMSDSRRSLDTITSDHSSALSRQEEILELDDIHYGAITKEVAETLCSLPGEYLIRSGSTESDLKLTVKGQRPAAAHSHFTIYKDKHPFMTGHHIYFLDDVTRQLMITNVSDLIIHVGRNPRAYICARDSLRLQPCSKRNKFVLDSSEVKKGREINSCRSSSRRYYTAKYRSRKVVLMERHDYLKILSEVNIRQQFTDHPNIVQYLGVTVMQPIYLVLPEEARYSLYTYAQQLKSSKVRQMIGICHNICCGMIYLHSYSYLVRSLQSTTCMVNREGVAKLLDLGKGCFVEGEFMEPLPGETVHVATRWAAPEVLKYSLFSKASDVWSFGVLTWEIFNKAKTPYSSIHDEHQLINELQPGYRLSLKKKHSMYDVVLDKCLRYNSKTRPSFDFLERNIRSLL